MESPESGSWNDVEGFEEMPAAFLEFTDSRDEYMSQNLVPIRDREICKIGRDPRSNTFVIENDLESLISRNHCEIYVVVYEPSINYIYVRDRKSSNGTYVNDELIGQGPKMTQGYLLEDGDVIEIRPYWKFVFRQSSNPPSHPLTILQTEECKLFADKYLVTERCIGHGAEAAVYLAIDKATKKQLVCKLVNLDKLHGGREELRRKYQEADVLRQLQHPNILPYIDSITSPHSLYTFTDLAAGGDLMSFTYRHSPVTELDTRIIIRQVIRGLGYLHEKGIVHRDLKPENILLAYSPKIACHRVMLSDFGTCAVPRRSRMLTNVGTAVYQAPEIQSMIQPHTPAVDIWSLGVVTMLLLTCDTDVDVGDMGRLDQRSLGKLLKEQIFKNASNPSFNGKSFVWQCLQISPNDRMNALEASCHDWFQTPQKHLDFFQRLDRRILADWELQTQLKPMPWELPNLSISPLCDRDKRAFDQKKDSSPTAETTSDHFTQNESNVIASSNPTNEQPETQLNSYNLQKPLMDLGTSEETPAGGACITTPLKPPLVGADAFQIPSLYTQPPHKKRKRSTILQVHDVAMRPLTGLDKHLRPVFANRQREQVLDELKKTNAKFLTGPPPMVSTRPPIVDHSNRASDTSKGYRGKYEALR